MSSLNELLMLFVCAVDVVLVCAGPGSPLFSHVGTSCRITIARAVCVGLNCSEFQMVSFCISLFVMPAIVPYEIIRGSR